MSTLSAEASARRAASSPAPRGAAAAWPWVAGLLVLAAVLRLSTLGLQSFWYDEAFTPVHVLHPSLSATLSAVVKSENTPPLWYLLEWVDQRLLGSGEVALRLPSALAGIATVAVAWAIGSELAGRRAAVITAVLVAVNPLLVWYSQEARAYALFVLLSAVAMLCFLRALARPTPGRMAAFALSGSLALLTHYFAVFLLIPMAVLLLREKAARRAALPAVGALVLVGLALLPLIVAQGGHGTQWIGRWALSSRLQAIPQYYLTGYSGAPLGHGVELLVALPILAGLALLAWGALSAPAARSAGTRAAAKPSAGHGAAAGASHAIGADAPQPARSSAARGAGIALLIAACGVFIPLLLAAFGADYLAPRNVVAAMVPLTAAIGVMLASPLLGLAGPALALALALAFAAVSVDVDLSPRLQRGNWRGVADVLRARTPALAARRAITTVELGSAPLEYYLPGLHELAPGSSVLVGEIDETGYAPLRPSAGRPPAPGFSLRERRDVDGLIVYRFTAPLPRAVPEALLRRDVITLAHPVVLVAPGAHVTSRAPGG